MVDSRRLTYSLKYGVPGTENFLMKIHGELLAERYILDKNLAGRVSLDRNTEGTDGHAWARYTSRTGEITILDVAEKFFGALDESRKRAKWDYRRPEDRRF